MNFSRNIFFCCLSLAGFGIFQEATAVSQSPYPHILKMLPSQEGHYRMVVQPTETKLELWEVDSRQKLTLVREFSGPKGGSKNSSARVPHFEDLSLDGRKILLSYQETKDSKLELRYEILDIARGDEPEVEISLLDTSGRIAHAKFSPSAEQMLWWSTDLNPRLALQGKKSSPSKQFLTQPVQVCQLVGDPISCQPVTLLSPEELEMTKITTQDNAKFALDFSLTSVSQAQGHLLVASDSEKLWLLDATSQRRLKTFQGDLYSKGTLLKRKAPILAFAQLSPDGSFIVETDTSTFPVLSASEIRIWRTNQSNQGQPFRKFPVSRKVVAPEGTAFSEDGKTLAMGIGSEIWLWDTTTWNKRVLRHAGKANLKTSPPILLFGQDPNLLIAVTDGKQAMMEFFDLSKNELKPSRVLPLNF